MILNYNLLNLVRKRNIERAINYIGHTNKNKSTKTPNRITIFQINYLEQI